MVQGSDYSLPESNFDKTFRTGILSREDWAAYYFLGTTLSGTSFEIFSYDLDIFVFFRLPNTCKDFRAEIYVMNENGKRISISLFYFDF